MDVLLFLVLLFLLVWKTGHNHAGSVGKQVNTYPVIALDIGMPSFYSPLLMTA
jgi:hypothetical protein